MTQPHAVTAEDFEVGQRVQVSPTLNTWQHGDRYGTVTALRTSANPKYSAKVNVELDMSGKVRGIYPHLLKKVEA